MKSGDMWNYINRVAMTEMKLSLDMPGVPT